ncbi:MAG TPA: PAS domain-containing protein, partial [Planctomycetaceae bacterium]
WDEAIGKTCLALGYPEWHAEMHDREIEQVVRTKEPVRGEVPFAGTLGRRVYDYIFVPVLGEDGEVEAVAGTTRDVTDLKRQEEELAEARRRLESALEAGSIGTWDWDIPNDRMRPDRNFAAIFGVRSEDAPGEPLAAYVRVIHPEDRGRVEEAIRRVTEQGGAYEEEYRLVLSDGSIRWVVARGRVEQDESGRPVRFPGVVMDITDRKLAEEALRASEERFRTLAEAVPQIVWVTRPDGWHEFYNGRWYEYTGLTPDESIGHGWNVPLHPDDRQRSIDRWKLACDTGEPYEIEYRFRRRDGVYRWFLGRALPVRDAAGAIVRWFGTCTDIDDAKRTEEQLRRNHDTFYHLIQHNPFGIYVVDADFRLRQVSEGSRKVFSNVRPLLGRDFAEVLRVIWPEPFASEAIGRFRHTLETGEPFSAPTTVERRADIGAVEAYDWRIERVTLPDGRFGVVCYFYDLSERQQWEAALRDSRERLLAALSASETGTFRWCPGTGTFLEFDDNLKRLFGLGPEVPVRTTEDFVARVHPDDRAALAAAVDRCRAGADFEMEFRVPLPDGRLRWLYDRAKMMSDADGRPASLVGACTDVTKRKEVEEALKEADHRKDEFLATLAHELRNPLAPIRMGVEMLRLGGGGPEGTAETLDAMEGQVRQMVRLIDDLLDVSRITRGKIALRQERVDLRAVLREAVDAAGPAIREAGLEFAVEPPGPLVLDADATRLTQVVTNLLSNAAKYTPPGGRVRLSAERKDGDAVIRVADTGVGLPADMLEKVFEPFTQVDSSLTRAQGGLGIGLALVKRLVELHGGAVAAASDGPGQGSVFSVRLPLSAGATAEAEELPSRPCAERPPLPPRKVLVVDDMRVSAAMLARQFEMLGQRVRHAYSAPA